MEPQASRRSPTLVAKYRIARELACWPLAECEDSSQRPNEVSPGRSTGDNSPGSDPQLPDPQLTFDQSRYASWGDALGWLSHARHRRIERQKKRRP